MEATKSHSKILKSAYAGARVLVVGGSGFIGRGLAKSLANLGAEVMVLGLRPEAPAPEDARISRLIVDMTRREELVAALKGGNFDYAFNLGGYIGHARYLDGGRKILEAHFVGLLNLLEALGPSPLKGFVQIGSSDEYGAAPAPQAEDLREAPISSYAAAKAAATHLVQTLARTENFPGAVVRYFLVYGPGQDDRRFLPQIIKGALEDKEFPTSSGAQLRDFCYLDDAVKGTLLAGALPAARAQVLNIASGRPVAIREVIETVVRVVGRGRPLFGVHPLRPGENMALYADTAKARDLLGFTASASLREGLTQTISWFRHQRGLA
jgi:nucleoside-diphosphate-sugar epimerase